MNEKLDQHKLSEDNDRAALEAAFQSGFRDAVKGIDKYDCPFDFTDLRYGRWRDGWDFAKKEKGMKLNLFSEVVLGITNGNFSDDQLKTIKMLVDGRLGVNASTPNPVQATKQKSVYDFKVGDRVQFNNQANPKYLIGTFATVTGYKRTKLVIKMDAKAGRFTGDTVRCPISIVDKV